MRTSAVGWVKTMADLARAQHLDVEVLFQQAGLNVNDLAKAHYRFPQDHISLLWRLLAEASGNAHIGLAFGRHVNLSTFGAVGYLFLSAPTVKQALEHSIKYQHYLGEALLCKLEKHGDYYHFDIRNIGDKQLVTRQTLDAILSSFVSLAAWIFRQDIPIEELVLGYGTPEDLPIYQQWFNCPVRFEAGQTRFVLSAAWVESALPSADPLMFEQQQKWLDVSISQSQRPLVMEVKKRIKALLPTGEANKEQVASSLFLTAKTLQRRLADESGQFQQLLDECRQELACEFLQQPHVELLEVAELVGYHDYSTFAKAFKQWTGQTPKGWREGR